ncbi:hypothetical protein K438DRAFT_2102438 [Mycena galopus ATCC 62051]|nr:hypothetical protein K438DRAFT_2102438 [Mycena galopus ATCC 62051]
MTFIANPQNTAFSAIHFTALVASTGGEWVCAVRNIKFCNCLVSIVALAAAWLDGFFSHISGDSGRLHGSFQYRNDPGDGREPSPPPSAAQSSTFITPHARRRRPPPVRLTRTPLPDEIPAFHIIRSRNLFTVSPRNLTLRPYRYRSSTARARASDIPRRGTVGAPQVLIRIRDQPVRSHLSSINSFGAPNHPRSAVSRRFPIQTSDSSAPSATPLYASRCAPSTLPPAPALLVPSALYISLLTQSPEVAAVYPSMEIDDFESGPHPEPSLPPDVPVSPHSHAPRVQAPEPHSVFLPPYQPWDLTIKLLKNMDRFMQQPEGYYAVLRRMAETRPVFGVGVGPGGVAAAAPGVGMELDSK